VNLQLAIGFTNPVPIAWPAQSQCVSFDDRLPAHRIATGVSHDGRPLATKLAMNHRTPNGFIERLDNDAVSSD
jgi:hypothetical protein